MSGPERAPVAATGDAATAGARGIAAAAAVAGFGCMAAELTAVRLLAPYFGDSAYVWTNVIGVILAALAAGAWLGGRLARENAPVRAWWCLLVAAACIAIAPWVVPQVGPLLVPAEIPLDAAMPVLVRGSFAATAILFAPAMVCLGAVAPLLVTALVRRGVEVGRAAGTVSASGTLGSLAGTFLATHWLVPSFGCRIAMAIAAGLLAVAAVPLRPGARRAGAAALAAVLAVSGGAVPGPLRGPNTGQELLAQRESRVQYLQVVREGTGDGSRIALRINEGLDSFHSLAITGSALTGAYYDYHALAPFLVGGGTRPAGLTALSIGDAAGTLRAVYAGVHPGATVDAVDVDAAAMELGDAYFPGPKARGGRYVIDGRVFLGAARGRWHVIHVDAYAHQVYVPAHLASREFFTAVHAQLHDGGIVACNVGALHRDDAVLLAIGTTLAGVFGHARALFVPGSRNALLIARRGGPPSFDALAAPAALEHALQPADAEAWRRLVAGAADPNAWCDVGLGGELLVDDRPVLDRLLADSYVATTDTGERVGHAGATAPAGAEADAFAAYGRRDWHGVLAAVGTSRSESAVLREYAGLARWQLRELSSADAELAAAAALAEDADSRQRLAALRARLADELAPVLLARRAASRAGWWQGGVLALAAAALFVLHRTTTGPAAARA